MSFSKLSLSQPILDAIAETGYTQPTDIQIKAIPEILKGHDVMAAAQTGTGKTAGFTLPILERLSHSKSAGSNKTRALVLVPTRELAAQVADSVMTYGKNLPLRSTVVFGGVKINPQMMRLRRGVDILVATPGRLLDLHQQNAICFDQLEVLVLDEADRMLDMGFIHDIKKIIRLLPRKRQNLLFSATFPDEVKQLAKGIVNQPVFISVTPPNTEAPTVEHWVHPVDKAKKAAALCHLIIDNQWQQVLVFARTKHGANRLAQSLEKNGISAMAIHGNKSQGARTRALASFKGYKIQVLVATDIAARGIDINQLPYVVNFDLPNVPEDYVHRIGRTGRAQQKGHAVSLVSADEFKQLSAIEHLLKKHLKRIYIDDFIPQHDVPKSHPNLDRKPNPNPPRAFKKRESLKNEKQKSSKSKKWARNMGR